MNKFNILYIPIKKYSERIKNKAVLPVKGWDGTVRPLFEHFLRAVLEANVFDRIEVHTDVIQVMGWCEERVRKMQPSNKLWVYTREGGDTSNRVNGNILLRSHYDKSRSLGFNPDIVWQGFITSPMITPETIKKMYDLMNRRASVSLNPDTQYDSIMSVKPIHGFFWNSLGQPVGYSPHIMPRSQDMEPLLQEVCGLFGITASAFNTTKTRYGLKPCMFKLKPEESQDIDWPSDVPGVEPAKPEAPKATEVPVTVSQIQQAKVDEFAKANQASLGDAIASMLMGGFFGKEDLTPKPVEPSKSEKEFSTSAFDAMLREFQTPGRKETLEKFSEALKKFGWSDDPRVCNCAECYTGRAIRRMNKLSQTQAAADKTPTDAPAPAPTPTQAPVVWTVYESPKMPGRTLEEFIRRVMAAPQPQTPTETP